MKSIQVLLGYSTLFTAEDSLSLFSRSVLPLHPVNLPLGRGFPPKTVFRRPFVCIYEGYWDHFSLLETPEEVLYITSGKTWQRREVSSPSVPSLLARFMGLQSHGAVKHHKKKKSGDPPTYLPRTSSLRCQGSESHNRPVKFQQVTFTPNFNIRFAAG